MSELNLPDNLREFHDMGKARSWLYDNTTEALKKRFPLETPTHRLELDNVKVNPKDYDLVQQKDALLRNRRLHVPVTGTWRLVDKSNGSIVDEREDTIMRLPYVTDRGTVVYNGSEYSSAVNQSRLLHGMYTRMKRSGEPEAMFNPKPGTGRGFRMWMQPDNGILRMQVQTSNIPLYSVLNAVGVPDDEMRRAWGDDLFTKNKEWHDPKAVSKLYARLAGTRQDPTVNDDTLRAKAIREMLEKSELDEGVVARNAGMQGVRGVNPALLVRTAQKLINIQRKQEDPDDRDHLRYSRLLSIEDYIPERVALDANKVARSLLYRASKDKSLKRVPSGALTQHIDDFILGSRIAQPLEETNPLSLLEQMSRITKLGEGGIGSADAVTDEARDVNPGQFGFVDLVNGPENGNIGIDVRAAYRTFKGRDNQIYAEFRDARTKKPVFLRPDDLDGRVLAFPGEMSRDIPKVTALVKGKMTEVPKEDVDFEIPSMAHMNASHTNMNPMPSGMQAARAFYGAKFWSQYMPVVNGEPPLVESLRPDSDETFGEYYGKILGTLRADGPSTVVQATDDAVVLKDAEGKTKTVPLVKHFPFNRYTGISYSPSVTVGQKVAAGDVIAHSNFVDAKTKAIRLGSNLRAVIVPLEGKSFEDAYTISASAAKRLSTDRLFGFDQEKEDGVALGRSRYASLFPKRFTRDQLDTIDDDGIVRPGTILKKGDPIILATGAKMLGPQDVQLGRLHKALRDAHTDKATIWDEDYEGKVVDALPIRGGARVHVAAQVPVKEGDKLATRYGLKGVVGKIVDDDKMLRDPATNEPYDIAMNPMGVLSRVAPAQIAEVMAARVAKITGKQIRIPQYPPEEGWDAWGKNLLKQHGLEEDEDVFDPESGTKLENKLGTGYVYVLPFHHLADKKLSVRGGGQMGYTQDMQPAKGGEENQQAKRISGQDVNALLAYGATDVLNDALVVRGSRNDKFFRALRLGQTLPEPEVPFIYEKLLNTLKAGGINIRQRGHIMDLMPMTDKDVLALSAGPLEKGETVDAGMKAIPGGLFDEGRTGGVSGKRWTHIELPDPVPNPVYEEPIRRLLGLTQRELEDVITWQKPLNGKYGGAAIKEALAAIDPAKEIPKLRDVALRRRGSTRDAAIKSLGYLSALQRQKANPADWMISKLPVLPPVFRPVSRMGDVMLSADMNELYRDVHEAASAIRSLRADLPDSALASERLAMYQAVTAAMGLGEPITPEGQSKRLKGAIRQLIGTSPKTGVIQSKVLAKAVDLVGRGVVTPDPNLDMDSVGIPEDSAWQLYKDFITRRLVRRGFPIDEALRQWTEKTAVASEALDKEMSERPVLLNRAPVWSKPNIVALNPHRVKGNVIRVSPLITKPMTMDFDGDQSNFHVPVTDKAVEQARRLLMPSANLFSAVDMRSAQYTPQQEMVLGLWQASRAPKAGRPVVRFPSVEAARKAYAQGLIRVDDPIEIG